MMHLHNPASRAHLDDLRDRLLGALGEGPVPGLDEAEARARVERLVDLVQAMDEGRITAKDALEAYGFIRIPGFSLGRWLVEMVDEGVYLDELLDEAA
ncbi:hypothetical protein [Rubellimicrobium roseum]|uniref:Uncharacterized protein n=1 Tax=Rubellimicrobium roseum TaxID=687525 RepID=A0A5C4NBT3_9RHOB|nr:hypothetical protein [Rubellimicrobium roseum]TNC71335.1 hypothetical protein FHG71_12130 [Rubellimicrobium roseum]